MAHVATSSLVRQLGSLFEGGSAAGLSDRQLLERFSTLGDEGREAAFATMVARHGPMVLGVCRQLLGDHHHAEDAFQAVFLVLARRARSIRNPDLLGGWLYAVTLRTARKARFRLSRRRQTEEEAASRHPELDLAAPAEATILKREQAEVLHGEIDRLPEPFRLALVFCYFEGLSPDEAAERLRWPSGTLRSRLVRARERLRRGLSRRGVVLSGPAIAALLAPRSTSASVPPLLSEATTSAAIEFAASRAATGPFSSSAAALARDVAGSMFVHGLKTAGLWALLLVVVVVGSGYLIWTFEVGGEQKRLAVNEASQIPTKLPDGNDRSASRWMTVLGRVVDAQGTPVPDARVAVVADRNREVGELSGRNRNILIATAAVDRDGRFALEFKAISASRLEHMSLIAAAPGRGLKVAGLKPDADRQEVSISLEAETPAVGRLVDVQGQPAAGLVVRVAKLNFERELGPCDTRGAATLWPAPATTDREGRFAVRGLGAGTPAIFEVDEPRFARQTFSLPVAPADQAKNRPAATITLLPAQTLNIQVTHGDDAKLVAGARVSVRSMGENGSLAFDVVERRTDGQGRVRIAGWPSPKYRIEVHPQEGEPYLPAWRDIAWPKAAVQLPVDFKLRRGVVVRGRVVDGADCVPVAGAWLVYYQTSRNNPRKLDLPSMEAVSDRDGRYTIIVPLGPGHVLVQGPSADYLHLSTSASEMGIGLRPSFRLYPDAHQELDLKDGEATYALDLGLRRGVTITGRVITPGGKPVAEAFLFGRSYTPFREFSFPLVGFNGDPPRIAVKDGQFEIPGCDPDNPCGFYFLDLADRLGATVVLSGQSNASGPVTVRLEPAASVHFLLKDANGRPLVNHMYADWPDLRLIITHGPDFGAPNTDFDLTPGDFAYQRDLDPVGCRAVRSGPDGYVTIKNLIPGAGYRFRGRDFTPAPGQTITLDDVVVESPKN
jgi:RNA polymerase sigma factor (sigma-70 family)